VPHGRPHPRAASRPGHIIMWPAHLGLACTWPRCDRSLRAERGRGVDSVHSAIPYEQYQLARSRAITPVRWRKHAVPGQLIQRYGIAACPALSGATSTCGHNQEPRSVSRKPDLPLTMVATSSCGPDDQRATCPCGHRTSPRSASRGRRCGDTVERGWTARRGWAHALAAVPLARLSAPHLDALGERRTVAPSRGR